MSNPGFDYAGELADTFDPDEERLVVSLYACRTCGALVTYMGRTRHAEWHRECGAACNPRGTIATSTEEATR